MKWMILLSFFLGLTACTLSNDNVIEYRQVVVAPADESVNIVTPVPIDVTKTVVSY